MCVCMYLFIYMWIYVCMYICVYMKSSWIICVRQGCRWVVNPHLYFSPLLCSPCRWWSTAGVCCTRWCSCSALWPSRWAATLQSRHRVPPSAALTQTLNVPVRLPSSRLMPSYAINRQHTYVTGSSKCKISAVSSRTTVWCGGLIVLLLFIYFFSRQATVAKLQRDNNRRRLFVPVFTQNPNYS